MKHLFLIAAMFGLVACVETATGGSGSGTGGTGGAAGTGASAGSGGTTNPLVECTDCLADAISWGYEGGLVEYTITGSITPCRSYTYTRVLANAEPPPPESCTVDLDACGAPSVSVNDLEQALAHPDVVLALANPPPLYGVDNTCMDAGVDRITVGSKTLHVGDACDSGASCADTSSCVPIPPGVAALEKVLHALQVQYLEVGECATKFP